MNILMISVRADIGGGPKHLLDLATYLKTNKEINLTIASPDEEPFAKSFKNVADHYIKIPKRSFNPFSYLKLLNHCIQNDIKIVHSHGRGAGVYGRLLSLFNIRSIHTFHGIHMEKNLSGKLKKFLDYFLHPLTNRYICVSNDERIKFLEIGFSNNVPISVIENGINHQQILNDFKAKRIKHDRFTLGTLARLHYQKGIDLLIETVSRNKHFFIERNIQIKIAGDGPDKKDLSESILKYNLQDIIFLSGQTFDPIGFLAELDCYFSFARWEGLPLSVLEAKACGLPTILSNVVGHDNFDSKFNNDNEFILLIEEVLNKSFKDEPFPNLYKVETMAEKTFKQYLP